MNKKTKIIAMYLPQYHEIPENNEFWGKGFTDWVSVKNAEPLYDGHQQPKKPLNDNYYDLSKVEILEQQAKLAKKYGIYGFCFYHYWFENEKTVLETPAQNLLKNSYISLPFCFAWDNTSWVRSWSKFDGNAWAPKYDSTKKEKDEFGREYLFKVNYGGKKEWEKHFEYLLPYFRDPRYIKIDGKPVFIFFSTQGREVIERMGDYWNQIAIKEGFPGIFLISRCDPIIRKKILNAEFLYQPITSGWQRKEVVKKYIKKILKISFAEKNPTIYNYDHIWKKIIRDSQKLAKENVFFGAFVNYDDSPRRGEKGKIVEGGTSKKFEYYLKKLYQLSCKYNKDFMFITAWNEWGEGAYLEPDTNSKYEYLEAIKRIVML